MAAREDPQLAVQSTAPQLAHAPQASLPPRPDVTRPAPPSSQRLPLPLLGPKPRVGVETSGAMAPAPRPVPLPRSTASAQPDGRGRHGAPGWPQPDQPRWIWNSAGAGGRIHRPSEPDRPGSANRIHPASAAAHPAAANRIHPALAPDHPGAPGPLNPPTAPQQKEITVDTDIRRRGTRIKEWGIQGDIEEAIESTGEHPIMYRALGTPPQSGHPFNLYFDIRSQPQALAETYQHADEVVRVAEEMARRDIWGVLGLGSGTSQFVAQVVGAALSRFAGLPAWDADSLAYRQYRPPYDFKKLAVIAYSGSGSTVDTVAAAQDATNAGAFTVAFTSVDGSPVVKATDMRVLTAGGFDTGGSDTFHYTTRLAAGILLALELGKRRHPNAHPYDRLKRELLDTAARMGESFDRVDARCQSIARDLHRVRSILIVGGGANCGTAEEIALKFDEMAHIPAKGMSPGRHIHGALGLTDEEILTLLVAPPGICYDELESIAEVTQILKTPSVALVSENDDRIAKMVDYVIRLPVEDETIFSVLAVLPGQLIPYWCGVNLGLNPDTQRSNVPKHARVWNMLFPAGTH
jgi:fructoselysine-6-P-deglycase FrlB-like protein